MSDVQVIDALFVEARLVEAAQTLMAMPGSIGPKALGAQSYGYVAEAQAAGKLLMGRVRLPEPTRKQIADMDEAMPWLALITNQTTRRIVAARSMVSLLTDKHLFSWRDIGKAVGASHEAVRVWHGNGIATIVTALLQGRV